MTAAVLLDDPQYGVPATDEHRQQWIAFNEQVRQYPELLTYIKREDPELYEQLDDQLSTLAIRARSDQWRHPLLGGRPAQLIPGTPGSFSDRIDWATWLLVGGRGCVARGTLIETPAGPVAVEDWKGGLLWSLHSDNVTRATVAGPAYRIGQGPLVRLTTDRGDEIVTTLRHRFLTPTGWVRASDVERGAFVASHQDRAGRSTSSEDGRRSWGTNEGSRGGCHPPHRRHDRQLQPDRGDGRGSLPLPGDALARTQRDSLLNDPVLSLADSRHGHESGHLSRRHSDLAALSLLDALCRNGPSASEPIQHYGRTARRFQQWIDLRPSDQPAPVSMVAARLSTPSAEAHGPIDRTLCESLELSNLAGFQLRQGTGRTHTDQPLVSERHRASSPNSNQWARVVDVSPMGDGDFYDLSVPGTHNYVANGIVNHNSGKSRTGAEAVREYCLGREWNNGDEPPMFALVGKRMDDVKVQMVQNTLVPVLGEHAIKRWNRASCEIWLHNGMYLRGFSSESPDNLRGPNLVGAWGDEIGTWVDADRSPAATDTTLSNLKMGLRNSDGGTWTPRLILTTTPRTCRLLRNIDPDDDQDPGPGLYDDPNTVVSNMSTMENRANLSPHFFKTVVEPLIGTRLYEQEVLGILQDETLGALWSSEQLASMVSRQTYAELQGGGYRRVVVGVDPSINAGLGDECGIVVVGLAFDGCAYIINDLSKRCDAREWVQIVADAFAHYQADAVVVEVNQGGELVEETIGRYAPNLPLYGVHAKKGKVLRAEPVALLSDQDKVRFAGQVQDFPKLAHQMRNYTGDLGPKEESPDRLDAMVYAVLHLLPPRDVDDLIKVKRRRKRR